MGKKSAAVTLCAFVASVMATPIVYASDPTLVGWWKFNEGVGTTILDSSDYGHDGALIGDPQWVTGKIGSGALSFDGSGGLVEVSESPALDMDSTLTITAWVNLTNFSTFYFIACKSPSGTAPSNYPGNYEFRVESATGMLQFGHQTSQSTDFVFNASTTPITAARWCHVAVTFLRGGRVEFYIDGVSAGGVAQTANFGILNDEPIRIGGRKDNYSYFNGQIDDVRIYSRVLTPEELADVMLGKGPDAQLADNPSPANEADEVLRDTALAWEAGEFAVSHDVYMGTVFDDVNNAGRDNPLGVLVSQGQADAIFDPEGLLEYGRTYYWRIDEVNGAPDNAVFKGEVWSFTAETYAYPIANLTVMASSQQATSPATRTIDGSGLDEFDQHGVDLKTMWVTPGGPLPAWIQYTFDKAYKLHELWVWNSNSELETLMGFGAKDVAIEYSTDGETWAQLENVPGFAKGTGKATYTANTIVNLGEVTAQYVKLTISDNWGATTMVSLSEVRFFYTPVQAFGPDPADGATGVDLAATLNWRPGREAISHEVYFGADANAVAEGTVTPEAMTDHSYTPAPMDLTTIYYWKVNEVGDTGTYEGDVWSFSAEDSILVDGFESYDDEQEAGTTIFQTWIDGYDVEANGSLVGHNISPFAEQTIVFAGKQSMPFAYDNATGATYSEAERTFDDAWDWTEHGVKTLSLYFLGDASNTGSGKLYVKINGTKVLYGGAAADLQISIWQPWTIDLASTGINLKKVTTLAIGVEGSGATGSLFFDEIRLYATASATVTPVDPGTTGLVAYYKLDGDAKDSAGSHHGTATGSPEYTTGKVGQALTMISSGQYVGVAYAADLAMSTFTVAAWINVADLDAPRAIVGTRIGGNYTFDVKAEATRIHGDLGDGTAWLNTSLDISAAQGGVIGIGEWHHVAYVIDNATQTCYMYLDGAPGSTATFSGTPMFMTSAETLGIGYTSQTDAEYMHGQIDEVRIYNRVLSDMEVAGLAGRTGMIYIAP